MLVSLFLFTWVISENLRIRFGTGDYAVNNIAAELTAGIVGIRGFIVAEGIV